MFDLLAAIEKPTKKKIKILEKPKKIIEKIKPSTAIEKNFIDNYIKESESLGIIRCEFCQNNWDACCNKDSLILNKWQSCENYIFTAKNKAIYSKDFIKILPEKRVTIH